MNTWEPAFLHKRKPGSWWKGRRVKLERPVRTKGGSIYRKGRIARVERKFGGLTLSAMGLYVTRVQYRNLTVEITI